MKNQLIKYSFQVQLSLLKLLKAKSAMFLIFFCSASLLAQNKKYLEVNYSTEKAHSDDDYSKFNSVGLGSVVSAGFRIGKWDYGLGISYQKYAVTEVYNSRINWKQMSGSMEFISLPVSVGYSFLSSKKSKLKVFTEISYITNFVTKQHFKMTFRDTTPTLEGPSFYPMMFIAKGGLKYEYNISKNFIVGISSNLTLIIQQFSPVYSKSVEPEHRFGIDHGGYLGLSLGLKYYLNKKSIK